MKVWAQIEDKPKDATIWSDLRYRLKKIPWILLKKEHIHFPFPAGLITILFKRIMVYRQQDSDGQVARDNLEIQGRDT